VLALARPRQWIKNALVVAAPGAAGALGQDDVLQRVLAAGAAFCIVSAGIYALNDARDHEEDRLHPTKQRRPVAAGEISPRDAVLIGVGWTLAGMAICAFVSPLLALVTVGYVALTVSYSLLWRNIAVLDLSALAAGFVLRAVAGGAAASVDLSEWFLLVVTFAAIFAAAGKRLGELLRVRRTGARARRVLRHYGVSRLRALLILSGSAAIFAYGIWSQRGSGGATLWRAVTVIPFAVAIARYAMLVLWGEGEAPEEAVISDRVLSAAGVAWLLLFTLYVDATV
jgi:decaprenyl-phosphate phosphoribosyltransferase